MPNKKSLSFNKQIYRNINKNNGKILNNYIISCNNTEKIYTYKKQTFQTSNIFKKNNFFIKQNMIVICTLILIIISNTFFNIKNKELLSLYYNFPFTITFFQFFSVIFIIPFLKIYKFQFDFKNGLYHTLSHLPMNLSIRISSINLCHTLKTLEPILNLIIGKIFFNKSYSISKIVSTMIIIFGVILSTFTDKTYTHLAIFYVFLSMFGNIFRNYNVQEDKNINIITSFINNSLNAALITSIFALYELLLYTNIDYLLIIYSFLSGMILSAYFLLSYFMIKKSDALTLSVTNVFKRIVLIFACGNFWNQYIYNFIAIIGMILFINTA